MDDVSTAELDINRELENPEPHTYIGLERLDEISKDEPTLLAAVEILKGESRQNVQAALDENERERWVILSKLGISEELEEYKEKFGKYPNDSKRIINLVISHNAGELPPVAPGFTRMYRGEGPRLDESLSDELTGRWFSPRLGIASGYPINDWGINSRYLYVDILTDKMERFHVYDMAQWKGTSRKDEYHLPNEYLSGEKEFARFIKEGTVKDLWPKPAAASKAH